MNKNEVHEKNMWKTCGNHVGLVSSPAG